jgi:hypothetical protein
VRRSAIEPRSAAAIARKSSTYATGAPWKFPFEVTRPSGSTTGLSIEAASSRAATVSACAIVSRTAPVTCGAQRSEYASCTRVSPSRCEATICEEASTRSMLSALAA